MAALDQKYDARAKPCPVSDTVIYSVTFSRYKMGNPVLYLLKVQILKQVSHSQRPVLLAKWTVKRRYSEMADCHAKLQKKFKVEEFVKFPPKNWSDALFQNEEQVQVRLKSLQQYFDKALLLVELSWRCVCYSTLLSTDSVPTEPSRTINKTT